MTTERVPPNSIDAEQSVLGSMMLEQDALLAGLELLTPADFYRPVHQDVFEALSAMAHTKVEVDIITLQEELRKRGKLEDCGGTEYLMALVNTVPTAAGIERYSRIVATKAEARRVIAACTEIIGLCYDPETEGASDIFVSRALATSTRKETEFRGIADVANDAWAEISKEGQGNPRQGIPYGVKDLSRITYGVEVGESEFTLIAGRPSSGKTLLLNEIAVNAAEREEAVIYFSQETSAKKLVRRMVFSKAGVDPHQFRQQRWASDDERSEAWDRVAKATAEIHDLEPRIIICDRTLPLSRFIPAARRAILRYKASIVLVDYLQIVGVDTKKRENRNAEVQEICRELKALSQDCCIPVVAATQLNRPPKGAKYVATLADLREGGNQEAEADKVIIVHNPTPEGSEFQHVNPDERSKPREVTFRVAKHKDGLTGDVSAWFVPGRFLAREDHFAEPSEEKIKEFRSPWWER